MCFLEMRCNPEHENFFGYRTSNRVSEWFMKDVKSLCLTSTFSLAGLQAL